MKILQLGLGVALLCVATVANAQKLTLKLEKGKKMQQITSSETTTTASVMGQDMENTAKTTSTTGVEVTGQTGTNTDLTMAIQSINAEMTSMGKTNSYDSEKKDNEGPLVDVFGKKINKAMAYTIDANGAVVKKPTDETSAEEGQMAIMGASVANTAPNSIYIESMLNKTIAVGTTWTDSTEVKGDMTIKNVNTYTVSAIEGDNIKLTINGVQTMAGKLEQMGQQMDMTGSNKITGTATVSMATGIVLLKETSTAISTTVEAMGMSIPVTGNAKAKLVNKVL
jgi:Family of unknown function (DUF6263)